MDAAEIFDRRQILVLNFGVKVTKARRAIRNGREYLVAPATIIVPQVLEGSKGKLFYPAEECRNSTPDWNGMPLVLFHPLAGDGSNVSAHKSDGSLDPNVWNNQGLGFIAESSMNGKLGANAWFDLALLRDPLRPYREEREQIYHNLTNGIPTELSTGLYTDNERALPGANYKGQAFDYIARNYRPDHLAVLIGQIGACSVNDGCGIGVVANRKVGSNGCTCNGKKPKCPT
jgi:hypothetical protein